MADCAPVELPPPAGGKRKQGPGSCMEIRREHWPATSTAPTAVVPEDNGAFVETRRAARTFIAWCGLCFAFLALTGIGAAEWAGFRTGVTLTPTQVAAAQESDKNILWLGPLKDWAAYKLARIADRQPEVVMIGHSRCNQFRSAMFAPYSMYNACLSAWTPRQIYQMIDKATTISHPKIIIFALDYFMFSEDYVKAYTVNATMDYSFGVKRHLHQLLTFLRNLSDPRAMMATLAAPEPDIYHDPDTAEPVQSVLVGYEALRAKAGYRYDGSFLYPYGERLQAAEINKDAANYVGRSFSGAPAMSKEQIAWLRRIAALGKERGVRLVALQLPFFVPAIRFLDDDPRYHPYAGVWREFESDATRQTLRDLGIAFFDTMRDPVDEDERNFVDPAHPNEGGDLALLLHLLVQEPTFREIFPRIDIDRLRRQLDEARTNGSLFSIYQNQF